ncbi:flagellar hook capping FlgD N-terminal domain-containing protein [Effusibacillus consociatus]|uniref:Flagellar hook capping FlgD N-terminal domain-containing protein n=1 Tax=Effusibacillus consociatus TaxID=1117041 RepID=A0ABV9Q4P6_9BACL
MAVSGTNGVGSTNSSADNKSAVSKQLGKDEFLKILLTQLKYQDPMSPMQDREFITQMAQFSALEQMTNTAHGLEKLQKINSLGIAFNLVGANVTYKKSDGGDVQGKVTGAEMVNGVMQLRVDDQLVDLADIIKMVK